MLSRLLQRGEQKTLTPRLHGIEQEGLIPLPSEEKEGGALAPKG